MTKRNVKKLLVLLISVLLITAVSVCLCACGNKPDNPKPNNPSEPETLESVLTRIRPTVVDVRAEFLSGSGVIIGGTDKSGDGVYDEYYIVTNHHVINGAASFSVTLLFLDEQENETRDDYAATLIGSSPTRDIAVLRISRKGDEKISVAEFIEDSDTVTVGTDVIAIGNSLGIYSGTVTQGVISELPKDLNVIGVGKVSVFQTTAVIKHGNSGGGLFDTKGRLIGITNGGDENNEERNYAIPANDAKSAAKSLIDTHAEDADGNVTTYGYAVDLQVMFQTQSTVYDSATSNKNSAYTLIQVKSEESPFYNDWGLNSAQAILGIVLNGVAQDISSQTKVKAIFNNLRIGDMLKITARTVKKSSSDERLYLTGESVVTITAEQTVYTLPDESNGS